MEESIDRTDDMFDHVLAGSLCFLGMAICMYMKFIRRQRPGFELVRPAKEMHSPPAHEYSASIAMDVKQPPVVVPKKATGPAHYVYQHPMRRRTHSSMSGNPEPLKPQDTPTVLAIETSIPEEKFYAKPSTSYPFSGNLEDGITYTDERNTTRPFGRVAKPEPRVLSPTRPQQPYRTVDEFVKGTPIVVSPTKSEMDLFASETDSLLHLESQSTTTRPSVPFGAPLREPMPFPPPMAPPLHRQASPLDEHGKRPFGMPEQQQPAQMQMEVARQAHIPLFLHMPLHVAPKPPPIERPAEASALHRTSHVEKRPSRGASFNFRIDFGAIALGELIGQGAFGTVHKGVWRETLIAVKILQCQTLTPDILEEFETEVHIMSVLRHPNICRLLGACLDPPTRCLIVEYIPMGSLWCVLRQPVSIDYAKQLRFARDTALGMHYLHTFDPPILHRDLKSPNLLVDDDFGLKISDFGLARVKAHQQTMTGNCGTTQWMAPEVLNAAKYTEKADVSRSASSSGRR
ncbi:TKL/DRK protein kinase [Saprolegnia parasitica CBS 223.65]|uniref:TKL/DRK protein kinase n=1 Tax=Saprolegnia parasitica (strain CBS 223.65) TaxID=695850 RepID=A0A067CL50_SAPPC|nr:TKL/DRK protein kinase [Saprolegnia parasitica CBS 223.65]KDO27537.1 TKL/DRK protein kinase [Saprolegnia parasitica CBS 223.65]|eukprot:XP_012201664.1 TKL/DRK protein kinase [Saprolegnia parasitica CBS 223.65]